MHRWMPRGCRARNSCAWNGLKTHVFSYGTRKEGNRLKTDVFSYEKKDLVGQPLSNLGWEDWASEEWETWNIEHGTLNVEHQTANGEGALGRSVVRHDRGVNLPDGRPGGVVTTLSPKRERTNGRKMREKGWILARGRKLKCSAFAAFCRHFSIV
jgi:hypothetical protein